MSSRLRMWRSAVLGTLFPAHRATSTGYYVQRLAVKRKPLPRLRTEGLIQKNMRLERWGWTWTNPGSRRGPSIHRIGCPRSEHGENGAENFVGTFNAKNSPRADRPSLSKFESNN
ncbi:hypothetical protein HD554DRAFT_1318783 [Boletus coccyginus]|nr:hypothetical protein HD554DRAFT_1318783 [Boletus coccyginus]